MKLQIFTTNKLNMKKAKKETDYKLKEIKKENAETK